MVCETFLFALRSYSTLTGADQASHPLFATCCTRTLSWQSLPRLNWSVGMSPLDSPCWYELVSEYISELDIEEFLPVLTFLDSY